MVQPPVRGCEIPSIHAAFRGFSPSSFCFHPKCRFDCDCANRCFTRMDTDVSACETLFSSEYFRPTVAFFTMPRWMDRWLEAFL